MTESRTYDRPKPVQATCCYCGKVFEADPWPERQVGTFAEKVLTAELALELLSTGIPVECGTCLPQPRKEDKTAQGEREDGW